MMLLEEEIPRGYVAESSAPLPVIQFPDGNTEPAPASSVLAENIIGQLTSEQIAELEAAKISGKLTAEQIESINAAQVVGKLVSEQIESIKAGQIKGEIEAAQIKSLPFEKITGEIKETQIGPEVITTPKLAANSVTAEKIVTASITTTKLAAGAVIAEKIAAGAIGTEKLAALAVTAEKIASGSITTEKLAALSVTTAKLAAEAIVAEKISAGAITTAKIAASAVTAEKISVKELSAIAANLGTVTAGTLRGGTIEDSGKKLRIDNTGINILANKEETEAIQWRTSMGGTVIAEIAGGQEPDGLLIEAFGQSKKEALVDIIAHANNGNHADLEVIATEAKEEIKAANAFGSIAVLKNNLESQFLQLLAVAKRQIMVGSVGGGGEILSGIGFTCKKTETGHYTIEFAASFGSTPIVVLRAGSGYADIGGVTAKELKVVTLNLAGTSFENKAFTFIAIG